MKRAPSLTRLRNLAVGCGGAGLSLFMLSACTQAERRDLARILFGLLLISILSVIAATVVLALYIAFLVLGLAMAVSGWSNPSDKTRKWGYIAAGANIASAVLVWVLDGVMAYAMVDSDALELGPLIGVGLAALPPLVMTVVNIAVIRRRPPQRG